MWQTLSCMQQGVLRVQTRSCAVRAHATAFCCHGGCVTCSVLLEMNCGVIEKFSNCWRGPFGKVVSASPTNAQVLQHRMPRITQLCNQNHSTALA